MEYLSGPTVDKVVERHLTGKKGGKKGTNIDSMKKKKKLGRGETSFYSLCKRKLIIHEIHSLLHCSVRGNLSCVKRITLIKEQKLFSFSSNRGENSLRNLLTWRLATTFKEYPCRSVFFDVSLFLSFSLCFDETLLREIRGFC